MHMLWVSNIPEHILAFMRRVCLTRRVSCLPGHVVFLKRLRHSHAWFSLMSFRSPRNRTVSPTIYFVQDWPACLWSSLSAEPTRRRLCKNEVKVDRHLYPHPSTGAAVQNGDRFSALCHGLVLLGGDPI